MPKVEYCLCPEPQYQEGICQSCKKWIDDPKEFRKSKEFIRPGKCICKNPVPNYSGLCQRCHRLMTFEENVIKAEESEREEIAAPSFTNPIELSVWSWSNINSVRPTSSSWTSRAFGDRSGRFKLRIGDAKWQLFDTKENKTLGTGLMKDASFTHKTTSTNGANLELKVDGGKMDIFEKGGGATLFSSGHGDLARKFDFLGRVMPETETEGFVLSAQGDVVIDSVYLGGASIPLKVYEKTLIHVSPSGFLIGQPGESLWSTSFEGLYGIQISGEGLYQTGGGWIGGGFGVSGALKGAAFASVMNALTTRYHNDCFFRFVYPGVDGNFQVLSHAPRDLEIALSGIRNWLETRKPNDAKSETAIGKTSNVEQLEKLWALHKQGILSESEFDKEKKKILDS